MTTPQDVIKVASSFEGYKENPAGSNRNMFGAWYGIDGVAWCAQFVSYVFYKAGLPLPPIQHPKGFCYCPSGVNYFKKEKKFFDKPQVGDIVFFDWDGNKKIPYHVGIVADIDNKNVYCWEGNTSLGDQSNGGEVMYRKRSLALCVGFARPDYDGVHLQARHTAKPWDGTFYMLTSPMKSGEAVMDIQEAVGAGADGFFGPDTDKAVKKFQKANGLDEDGIVGASTWNAMFNSVKPKKKAPAKKATPAKKPAAKKATAKKTTTKAKKGDK
jgi:cell wall-associated NlpC family hydrolase